MSAVRHGLTDRSHYWVTYCLKNRRIEWAAAFLCKARAGRSPLKACKLGRV